MFKVGVDVVDLERLAKIVEETPGVFQKFFREEEIRGRDVKNIGGKWAAKEALVKAGVIGVGAWLEVTVDSLESGQPVVRDKHGKILDNVSLSITHTDNIAAAVVIYEDS